MANHFTDAPSSFPESYPVIDFYTRRRLHDCIDEMLTMIGTQVYSTEKLRRRLAEADVLFGDEVVCEIERAYAHEGDLISAQIILLLRMLATDAARTALRALAMHVGTHPWTRYDALRELKRLGENVAISELIALAEACEHVAPYFNYRAPYQYLDAP